jgi:hypothetical protein
VKLSSTPPHWHGGEPPTFSLANRAKAKRHFLLKFQEENVFTVKMFSSNKARKAMKSFTSLCGLGLKVPSSTIQELYNISFTS